MREQEVTQTVVCDRCHKSIRSVDRPKFFPEGWKLVGDFDLCPNCAADFADFMGWATQPDGEGAP